MRSILSIATFETRKFFYSPIAWTVVAIFIVQLSYAFTHGIAKITEYQFLSSEAYRGNFSMRVFIGKKGGVFDAIINSLFLYIPLLSMGLFSRELNSGSYKLLFSSSVSSFQLVAGKLLSMVFLGLIFALTIVLLGLGAGILIEDFQYQLLIPGVLAILLLLCAYSSIGLFISSFTSYQIVAAILTFGLLLLLNVIGSIGQNVPYLSEVLFWLSISDRAEQLTDGLLKSSSLFYYLILTMVFLAFTVINLTHRQSRKPVLEHIGAYSLVLLFGVLSGYLASRPHWIFYHDFTPDKRRTLSKQAQAVAAEFKDVPIKMKAYVNVLSKLAPRSGLPHQQNADYREFDQWTRFLPQLEFEYIYFYDSIPGAMAIYQDNPGLTQQEIAEKYARAYNVDLDELLTPSQITKLVDLSGENNEYVRQFEARGKTAWLRMFKDLTHYPGDDQIAAALHSLLIDPPLMGILQGHGERSITKKEKDYYKVLSARADNRYSARNLGYDFREVYLDDSASLHEIDVLLIADPAAPFNEDELTRLKNYIASGKNLVLLLEPDKKEVLQPLCSLLSVDLFEGALADTSHDYPKALVFTYPTRETLLLSQDETFQGYTGIYDLIPVVLPSVVPFSVADSAGFDVLSILKTNDETTLGDSTIMDFEVGVALQRQLPNQRDQRIIVVGDADFLSNSDQRRRLREPTANQMSLIRPIFWFMSYDQFPLAAVNRYPETDDNRVYISSLGVGRLKLILLILLPALILLANTIYLQLRKRH